MKTKIIILITACVVFLSACGEANTTTSNLPYDESVDVEIDKAAEEIAVSAPTTEDIAAAYLEQLRKSCDQMEEESRTAAKEAAYDSPYDVNSFYRIEDFNKDDIPELVVVAYADYGNEIYEMSAMPALLGTQIYTYREGKVEPVYLSESYVFNGSQEASYDFEKNQFYHTIHTGGGGGYGWVDVLVYGMDGALQRDVASGDVDLEMGVVHGTIYEQVQEFDLHAPWDTDFSSKSTIDIDENGEVWKNRISNSAIQDYRKNNDYIYLRASDTSIDTMLALLNRGTTTAYDANRCRYYLSDISFEQKDDGIYVTGNLSIEKEYQEYFQRPDTEPVRENVTYKLADGASCFTYGGAYLCPMQDLYWNRYGVVVVDDEYVYGMLANNAE